MKAKGWNQIYRCAGFGGLAKVIKRAFTSRRSLVRASTSSCPAHPIIYDSDAAMLLAPFTLVWMLFATISKPQSVVFVIAP
jgi:hypothetical protein